MMKYFKNFIVCNDIDYYCLLCHEPFVSSAEVEKHIRWENHRKLMKTQTCLSKFGKDGIFKIQDKLYYCEICNYLATTLGAVKAHVKEEKHITNKGDPEKVTREVIAERKFGLISIKDVALLQRFEWHGVVDKYCMHCETPANVFDTHAALPSHMINFMQSELVKAGKDDRNKDVIYRKLKNGKYYCFKCKQKFPAEELDQHWADLHTFNENAETPRMLFEIDALNDLGICTKCHKTCDGYMQIIDHKKEHIKKNEWAYNELEDKIIFTTLNFRDKGKVRSALKNYGKDNYIKLNEGGSKGYCNLCHTHIPAHIRNFKQHVGGMHHQAQLELKGLIRKTKKTEKAKYKSKPFIQYLSECYHVKNAAVFLIPEAEVVIDVISFAMIIKMDKNRLFCFICDELFSNISEHLDGSHKEKMMKTYVVTSVKSEFIREPRPGYFHCGVCNMIFGGWPSLERHLSSFKHIFTRNEAHKMIEQYVDTKNLEANMFDLPFTIKRSLNACKTEDFLD